MPKAVSAALNKVSPGGVVGLYNLGLEVVADQCKASGVVIDDKPLSTGSSNSGGSLNLVVIAISAGVGFFVIVGLVLFCRHSARSTVQMNVLSAYTDDDDDALLGSL